MKQNAVLIDLHYLPCLEYFTLLLKFDTIIIEAHEHFQKQSYRNRCYINGANNIQSLIVPVCKGSQKTKIKDVKINYKERWYAEHWRSLQSAYGKAPFFDYFAEIFNEVFVEKPDYLFDLNLKMLNNCLEILDFQKQINFTKRYDKMIPSTIFDARSRIHPKRSFKNNDFYSPVSYNQIFGKEFDENLSVVDLIFCEGMNGRTILNQSIKL